jgi:6-phosphogluconolactonase
MGDQLAWRFFSNAPALSRGAAETVAAAAREAVAERGRFALALSGGRTPADLYRLLAGPYREQVAWSQVHLFFGDERFVPWDDPASNYRMVQETLLAGIPVPAGQVHPIPVVSSPEEAAAAYEAELRTFFGEAPAFDLVLLGMGADGHTASLFPGTAAVDERQRWVAVGRASVEPAVRLTLTRPVLAGARRLLFLVTGSDKEPVIREIQASPEAAAGKYPAALIAAEGGAVDWYVSV